MTSTYRAGLCAVFLGALTATPARAQEPPTGAASELGDRASEVPLAPPMPASFGWNEGTLEARGADGAVLRGNPLNTRAARPNPEPRVIAGVLVACAGSLLYTLEPTTLAVRTRRWLPGRCVGLEPVGERALAVVEAPHDGGAESGTERVVVDLASTEPSSAIPSALGLVAIRARARVFAGGVLAMATPRERMRAMREPARRAEVEAALVEVDRRAADDATNPWFDLERANLLTALGRSDEAARARARAFEHPPAYDADLLMAASDLELLAPELADRAFERGLSAWIRAGYEPELAFGLVDAFVVLGRPDTEGNARERFEHLAARAERLAAFAPHVEAGAGFFEAMRREAHRRRDPREPRFAALRDAAMPSRTLGPLPVEGRLAGHLLNGMAGLGVAVLVLFALGLVKARGRRAPAGANAFVRVVPIARFSVPSRVGLGLAALLLLGLGSLAALGVGEIALIARAPVGFLDGHMGDAASRAFTRKLEGSGEGRFVRGYALQRGGDTAGAARAYARSSRAAAFSNRGVMLAAAGDAGGARRAFTRALAIDPSLAEAAINLGRPAASARVARLRRAGLVAPFIAIPSSVDLGLALRRAVVDESPAILRNPFRATVGLFTLTSMITDRQPTDGPVGGLLYLVFGLALLALVVPGHRTAWESTGRGRAGWMLGLLIPGGSRAYGPFGVLVLGVFVAMVFGAVTLVRSDGLAANALDLVTTPAFERYFGAIASVPSPEESRMRAFYGAWWIVLIFHYVFVAITERRYPDPLARRPDRTGDP